MCQNSNNTVGSVNVWIKNSFSHTLMGKTHALFSSILIHFSLLHTKHYSFFSCPPSSYTHSLSSQSKQQHIPISISVMQDFSFAKQRIFSSFLLRETVCCQVVFQRLALWLRFVSSVLLLRHDCVRCNEKEYCELDRERMKEKEGRSAYKNFVQQSISLYSIQKWRPKKINRASHCCSIVFL